LSGDGVRRSGASSAVDGSLERHRRFRSDPRHDVAGGSCGDGVQVVTTAGEYDPVGPSREDVDRLAGATVLEFGTPWCGYCGAAQPFITTALAACSGVRHVKVEDGSGKPLGRSFGVKLWPTLVFLKDGKELARSVRPWSEDDVRRGLDAIS